MKNEKAGVRVGEWNEIVCVFYYNLRKTHPPAPGKIPKEVSGRHKVASWAATRRSQAKASSRPQPKQGPVSRLR